MSPVTGSYQNTTKPPHQYLRRAGHLVDAWDNYITRMLVTQNHLPQPTSQNNQRNTTSSKQPAEASTQQQRIHIIQPNQTQGKPTRSSWSPPEFLSFQIQSAVQGLGWVGFFSCGESLPVFVEETVGFQKSLGLVTMVLTHCKKNPERKTKKTLPQTNGFDALAPKFSQWL